MYLCGPSPIDAELEGLCREHGALEMISNDECEARIRSNTAEITASGCFHAPTVYRYPWSQSLGLQQFIGFLATGNGYLRLEPEKREELHERLASLFGRNHDTITMSYLCVLYLAQRLTCHTLAL
jgi:hypothetical protein